MQITYTHRKYGPSMQIRSPARTHNVFSYMVPRLFVYVLRQIERKKNDRIIVIYTIQVMNIVQVNMRETLFDHLSYTHTPSHTIFTFFLNLVCLMGMKPATCHVVSLHFPETLVE